MDCRSGIEAAPNNPKVLYNWANYLRDVKRYSDAVKEYEKVLKLEPTYVSAINNLATILENNEETLVSESLQLKHVCTKVINHHFRCFEKILFSFYNLFGSKWEKKSWKPYFRHLSSEFGFTTFLKVHHLHQLF